MTVIHRIAPARPSLLSDSDGLAVDEAIAAAEANLLDLRPALLGEIDASLQRLRLAVDHAGTAPESPSAQLEVYSAAALILGFAGLCGLTGLGEAAERLCTLVDGYIEQGDWNAEAVAAHLQVMSALRLEHDRLRQRALGAFLRRLQAWWAP